MDSATVGGPLARLTGKLRFAVGVLRWVRHLSVRGERPDCIYTFHSHDLVLGAILRALGFTWVVDILDLPEALHWETADVA